MRNANSFQTFLLRKVLGSERQRRNKGLRVSKHYALKKQEVIIFLSVFFSLVLKVVHKYIGIRSSVYQWKR